jgi:hypothetical protein
MIIFVENPMPVILIGILLETVLGVVFVVSRRKPLLWAMVSVAVLVAVGVLVERLVVTERERAIETMESACRAVEANDAKRVRELIAENPTSDILKRLEFYMGMVEFTKVRIHNVKVDINRLASPPTAKAQFDGNANYKDKTGSNPYSYWAGSFVVQLVQSNGQWKIKDVKGDPMRPRDDVR